MMVSTRERQYVATMDHCWGSCGEGAAVGGGQSISLDEPISNVSVCEGVRALVLQSFCFISFLPSVHRADLLRQ